MIIAGLSIIVAHGWRWRSLVSLVSIYAILMIVVLLSMIGGALGNLTGIYDESSALLQISNSVIDLRGVFNRWNSDCNAWCT